MKLRCTTNSIRLRLRRSEVDTLQAQGQITEFVNFGPTQHFYFSLCLDTTCQEMYAKQTTSGIVVCIPYDAGSEWAQSDQVGLDIRQSVGDGEYLDLLVEKDFPCATRPDEDKTDFFGDLQSSKEAMC